MTLFEDKVTEDEALNDQIQSQELKLRPRQSSPPIQPRPPLAISPPELLTTQLPLKDSPGKWFLH